MKKILLTAALLAASVPAFADTATANIGKEETLNTSSGQYLPVNLNYKQSVSQSIYTEDMLGDLYSVDASSIHKANISSVTFYINVSDGNYLWDEYNAGITVYAQTTDASEFATVGGSLQWFDYSSAVKGSFSINTGDLQEPWDGALWDGVGGNYPVTITFDTPIEYAGGSLVLTWVSESDMDGNVLDQSVAFTTTDGKMHSGVVSSDNGVSATGDLAHPTKALPYIQVAYEEVVEPVGPSDGGDEPVVSDPMTSNIGNDDLINTSSGQYLPINPFYANSVSQSVFTADLLGDLYKVDASSKTVSKISSMTFFVNVQDGNYIFDEYNANITVYAQTTDASEFASEGGKLQWFDYSSAVKGTATISTMATEWEDALAWGMGGNYPVTVTFDTPIEYAGGSLVLTWECSSDFSGNILDESVAFNTTDGKMHSGVVSSDSGVSATGELSNPTKTLPYIQLTYVQETTKLGPTVVEGDPTTANIGSEDLTGASLPGITYPVSLDNPNSVSQSLYTADLLSELYKVDASSVQKAKITSLKFYVNLESVYVEEGSLTATVYAKTTDATEFDVIDGKPQWFDYSDAVKGTATIDTDNADWADGFYMAPGTYPVTVTFDTPLEYAGNSLLLTWESACDFVDVLGGMSLSTNSVVFNPKDGKVHSAIAVGNSAITVSGNLENTTNELPYITIGYTPLIEQGSSVTPVLIEDVAVSLEGRSVAAGTFGYTYTGSTLNNVAVRFTLNDAANAAPYEIKLGTKSLGTVNTKDVTINYLAVPTEDIVLSVVPQGEGAIGSSVTIAAADIQALFPAPDVKLTDRAVYGTYAAHQDRSFGLDGAAKFHVTAEAPAALIATTASQSTAKLMLDADDYAGPLAALVPAGISSDNYADLSANGGDIAYAMPNMFSATVKYGKHVLDESKSALLTVAFGIDYPVVSLATPQLVEGRAAFTSTEADIADKGSFVISKYNVAYNNGGLSYSSNQVTARFSLADDFVTVEPTYPDRFIQLDNDDKSMTFFAPAGEKLLVLFRNSAVAEQALSEEQIPWDDATVYDYTEPFTLSTDSFVDDNDEVYIGTKNTDGVTYQAFFYKDLSGINDVTVDVDGAEAVYYNLQGVRVEGELAPGMYIRRVGNAATKVIIR